MIDFRFLFLLVSLCCSNILKKWRPLNTHKPAPKMLFSCTKSNFQSLGNYVVNKNGSNAAEKSYGLRNGDANNFSTVTSLCDRIRGSEISQILLKCFKPCLQKCFNVKFYNRNTAYVLYKAYYWNINYSSSDIT